MATFQIDVDDRFLPALDFAREQHNSGRDAKDPLYAADADAFLSDFVARAMEALVRRKAEADANDAAQTTIDAVAQERMAAKVAAIAAVG